MYLPFAFLLLSLLTGGNLLSDIIGIAAGHFYYFLKDVCPIQYRKDYLITPDFVRRWFQNVGRVPLNNTGSSGSFSSQQTNNNSASSNSNSTNASSRGGFQAFAGTGRTWS